MDHEEYVRSKWERVEFHEEQPHYSMSSCVFLAAPFRACFSNWQAAYEFTLAREEEIRQVEEERSWLRAGHSENNPACVKRILIRTEAHLADLRKGMK